MYTKEASPAASPTKEAPPEASHTKEASPAASTPARRRITIFGEPTKDLVHYFKSPEQTRVSSDGLVWTKDSPWAKGRETKKTKWTKRTCNKIKMKWNETSETKPRCLPSFRFTRFISFHFNFVARSFRSFRFLRLASLRSLDVLRSYNQVSDIDRRASRKSRL